MIRITNIIEQESTYDNHDDISGQRTNLWNDSISPGIKLPWHYINDLQLTYYE